jgi:anti-sigma regulatory factor (Ser/Thr protein kinase)
MALLLQLRLAIDSTFSEVSFVACAIHSVSRKGGLGEEAAQELELAAVEALNNVVQHAHRGRHDLPIDVSVEAEPGRVTVEIVDHGRATTADRFTAPDEPELDPSDIAGLAENGRGIALMRQLLDGISYVPGPDGNRLRLTKLTTRAG